MPTNLQTKTPKTPTPDDLPITPRLQAWWETKCPGQDLPRALEKFLLYTAANGITNADWTAAFCFYTLTGLERQAALAQQQLAAAARREAWRAQWQAEPAHPHPDDPWRCDQCGVRHATLACYGEDREEE